MAKTFQQIQVQMAALQKQAEAAKKREVQKVVRDIKAAIAVYELTATDLGLEEPTSKTPSASRKSISITAVESNQKVRKARKSVATPKASSPKRTASKKKTAKSTSGFADGAGNTWSGRGPRPKWFKDALEQGKTPDELRA